MRQDSIQPFHRTAVDWRFAPNATEVGSFFSNSRAVSCASSPPRVITQPGRPTGGSWSTRVRLLNTWRSAPPRRAVCRWWMWPPVPCANSPARTVRKTLSNHPGRRALIALRSGQSIEADAGQCGPCRPGAATRCPSPTAKPSTGTPSGLRMAGSIGFRTGAAAWASGAPPFTLPLDRR